ncbi:LamG-like jellyroll fold domain-containing protein [Catellatospora sichuanensis]|uniref:LamG-like jellyroll fold domain-containing protein n=1 Tax=Catellatospora sichuanensis TaxID=1969805 RepID=UPI0016428409|nr:LamG-like jellyroll fold domain-containing protein [Catellatospora sichuanensis]
MTFGGVGPAYADPVPVPSLVDDGAYPGAAQILAEQNVRLIAGDGHIVLADCATPPVGDIGLLKVHTTDETIGADGIGRVCFQVTAPGGWLSLMVPGVYEIRGDGQRTGTGHEVTAELVDDDDEQITVTVDPDGSTPVGLGADPNAAPTMLLQLRAGAGLAPVTGAQAAVGKLTTRERMCTVTLVAPRWVLGAAGCFAADPLAPALTEGVPVEAATVVFPGHAPVGVNWLSPRAGRDVTLARLAAPIVDVTPVGLAAAVAPVGLPVPAVGYGHTATGWLTDAQQTAQITFGSGSATTLMAASGPLVCKGMAGAPIIVGGSVAAILSRAGQAGCFETTGAGSAVTAARTDGLATWFTAVTTADADHTWSLADAPGMAGEAVTASADVVYAGTGRPLTATAGATWSTGDTFSPAVDLNGTSGSLATSDPAVATEGSFTVSAWVKPTTATGSVLSQDGGNGRIFDLYASGGSARSWMFGIHNGNEPFGLFGISSGTGTVEIGKWTHLTATYSSTDQVMKLYVNGVEVAAGHQATAPIASSGAFRVGASRANGSVGNFFAGRVSTVRTWNRLVEPAPAATSGAYYQRLAAPTRFLDTRTGIGAPAGAVARNTVVRLQIAGVNGIPATGVTAVALNLAAVAPADRGWIKAWPDLTPRPYATTMVYAAGAVTSGYAIVPVGSNGYINISPVNPSPYKPIPPVDTSTQLIADVSGYFTTDSGTGASSYTPFGPKRFADSRTGAGGHSGLIAAGATRDYKVTGLATGSVTVPNGITAVVANVTTVSASAAGFITTWEQGQAKPAASGLQYRATDGYAGMAIIPVNPATGKFSLSASQSTHVVIDVLGYFTPGTAGLKYHTFPSVSLLDTSVTHTFIPAAGSTTVLPPAAMGTGAVLIAVLTASADVGGNLMAYPDAPTAPDTSTLNYRTTGGISNLAIVPGGTGGAVKVAVSGSAQVWASMSSNGYFAGA